MFLSASSNPHISRVDEADIEKQVDELRQKLLANLASSTGSQSLKPTDTHGMAAAKKIEVARMARALGTRPDYQEGDAFDREKQELNKLKRIAEREEREKRRVGDKARMAEQKAKWESERKERDILRRKEDENRINAKKEAMPPPPVPTGPRREYQERDRPRQDRYRSRRDSYPRGPPPSRDRDMAPPSPPRAAPMSRPKRDRESLSRSPSPPARTRRRLDSRSPSRSLSKSRSPPPRSPSRSRSPMRGVARRSPSPVTRAPPPVRRGRHPDSRSPSRSRSRSISRSRSRSPPRRSRYRSNTPPPPSRNERTPPYLPTPAGPTREGSMRQRGSYRDALGGKRDSSPDPVRRGRSRSGSTGSSMSVSTRSGSGSRHENRGKGRARD